MGHRPWAVMRGEQPVRAGGQAGSWTREAEVPRGTHLKAVSPTTPYHTALVPRKRKRSRAQQVARWTRVKRLLGGRSQRDSQMCLSKKPRCSSATRRRRKQHRAASPEEEGQQGVQHLGLGATPPLAGRAAPYLLPAPPSPPDPHWPPCPPTASHPPGRRCCGRSAGP